MLMAIAYACHIAGSPFLRFVEDQNILVPLYVIEGISLFWDSVFSECIREFKLDSTKFYV